jgi:eukaryotic-like serine/threonine-protein kinase
VPGTEDATYPFWSPDGRSLGFFSRSMLRRVDLAGGPPRALAEASNGRGGAWSGSGDILFAPNATGTIRRINANGGTPVEATRLEERRGENSHRWPSFLPDGRRFVYFARTASEHQAEHEGLYVASLDDQTSRFIVKSASSGVVIPPNRLLYVADGSLVARPFDPGSGQFSEDPVLVAEHVGTATSFYSGISASGTGVLAYASEAMMSDLQWIDRKGTVVGTALAAGQHVDFRIAPDGRTVALAMVEPESDRSDIYLLDLARGTRLRATSSPATDASPVWSPDGRRLIFRSNREAVHDLYMLDVDGSGSERKFQSSSAAKYPTSWSGDGKWVAYHTRMETWDVTVAPVDGSAPPHPAVASRFSEMQAQFSPDGRWLAYTSDESGPPQVYLRSLGGRDLRRQVSATGGSDPRWRADTREIYYVRGDGWLTAVSVTDDHGTPAFGRPEALFHINDGILRAPFASSYDVTPDGQRFLVRVVTQEVRNTPLTVLVNRFPALSP